MDEQPIIKFEASPDDVGGSTNQEYAERSPKMSISVEEIFNNPTLFKKVYESLSSKKPIITKDSQSASGGTFDNDKEIDFGPEYQKTTNEILVFYIRYYLGLTNYAQQRYEDVIEYLRLRLEGSPDESEAFLNYLYELDGMSKEQVNKIRDAGYNLSSIIPGAPNQVMETLDESKYPVPPKFSARDTGKVDDIYNFSKDNPEKLAKITSFFEGKTVIDLGAGAWAAGLEVADRMKAKYYVGVDKSNALNFLHSMGGKLDRLNEVKKTHIAQTDMKTFLSNLPNQLPNFLVMISGIDQYMLGTSGLEDTKQISEAGSQYYNEVCSELSRALGENGLILTYASTFYFGEKEGFERVAKIDCLESPIYVFRRIQNKS